VSTRSSKLAVSSSSEAEHMKPVTRSSSSVVSQQPVKRMLRSLPLDDLPRDTLRSTEASYEV